MAADCGGKCSVRIDFVTDNLIVDDGVRGFPITHLCLDTWRIEKVTEAVKEALQDMKDGRETDRNGVRFMSLEELAERGGA